jgi:hypothetical protein
MSRKQTTQPSKPSRTSASSIAVVNGSSHGIAAGLNRPTQKGSQQNPELLHVLSHANAILTKAVSGFDSKLTPPSSDSHSLALSILDLSTQLRDQFVQQRAAVTDLIIHSSDIRIPKSTLDKKSTEELCALLKSQRIRASNADHTAERVCEMMEELVREAGLHVLEPQVDHSTLSPQQEIDKLFLALKEEIAATSRMIQTIDLENGYSNGFRDTSANVSSESGSRNRERLQRVLEAVRQRRPKKDTVGGGSDVLQKVALMEKELAQVCNCSPILLFFFF